MGFTDGLVFLIRGIREIRGQKVRRNSQTMATIAAIELKNADE